jgi:hypothetical protein
MGYYLLIHPLLLPSPNKQSVFGKQWLASKHSQLQGKESTCLHVESKSIGQVVGIHGHLENGCWFNSPAEPCYSLFMSNNPTMLRVVKSLKSMCRLWVKSLGEGWHNHSTFSLRKQFNAEAELEFW